MAGHLEEILSRLEKADAHDQVVLGQVLDYLAGLELASGLSEPLTLQSVGSTDGVLHLIDDITPGWSIHIIGQALEANGHWKCTLRRSSSLDDDEFVGIGGGKVLLNAMLAALLRVVSFLTGRRSLA